MYFAGYLGSAQIEKYYKDITTELARTFDIENLSKRVPAHITLRYPFEIESYSDIQNKIIQLLPRQKTQHLFIDGFGHFGDETIYLNVKVDNHEMFIKKYVRGLGEYGKFQNDGFTLHVSIARGLSSETFEKAWFYLMTIPKPYYDLTFDNITIFEFDGDSWKVNKSYPMTGI